MAISDDDHSYSPDLLHTLLQYSLHPSYSNASVGLRGWRVRQDLIWGVSPDEAQDHIAEGWMLASPYRVGVLTANEGYLIYPRFFGTAETSPRQMGWLLDTKMLLSTSAHLVDDIWMAGHLCARSIPRYVVPLLSRTSTISFRGAPAIPSIDVTRFHTLEAHIVSEGTTRGDANTQTIRTFAEEFRREGLFYDLRQDRERAHRDRQRKPKRWQSPERLGRVRRIRMRLLKLVHHTKIRILYGQ